MRIVWVVMGAVVTVLLMQTADDITVRGMVWVVIVMVLVVRMMMEVLVVMLIMMHYYWLWW